jgi:hypothetical protein
MKAKLFRKIASNRYPVPSPYLGNILLRRKIELLSGEFSSKNQSFYIGVNQNGANL